MRTERPEITPQLVALQRAMNELEILNNHVRGHKHYPLSHQSPIVRSVFNDKCAITLAQCGRNFGKTTLVIYCVLRYATMNPGSLVWIITPELKQGAKIYWQRLIRSAPKELLLSGKQAVTKGERTLNFRNGSQIMLDGCENYDALRGVKPDFVVYDEVQDHNEFFDEEVMQPNLQEGGIQLMAVGTPPKAPNWYCEFREGILDKIASGRKDYAYYECKSEDAEYNCKNWLAEKKADLIKKGKHNTWLREYEAKLVYDMEGAIFPMWRGADDLNSHVKSHEEIRAYVKENFRHLDLWDVYDPATGSVFAGMFAAINRYTGKVIILDEIYETQREKCTAGQIWKRADAIKEQWTTNLDDFRGVYDEAEAWFRQEVLSLHRHDTRSISLNPTHKRLHSQLSSSNEDGRPGESVIMSAMMEDDKLWVSERCVNFQKEIIKYKKKRNKMGNLVYPKKDDHLIDCFYYLFLESCYSTVCDVDEKKSRDEEIRAKTMTMQQEIDTIARNEDFFDADYDDPADLWDEAGDIW